MERSSNNICNRSFRTLCIAVLRQADDMSLKQAPLGGCVGPLVGRVGSDDIADGIED